MQKEETDQKEFQQSPLIEKMGNQLRKFDDIFTNPNTSERLMNDPTEKLPKGN